MGVVALNTPAMGRAAVGNAPVGNIQMALAAFEGRHLRWIAVGIMAVLALKFIQS